MAPQKVYMPRSPMSSKEVRQLILKCDNLWARIVKLRDQEKCVICGSNFSLQSHHAFRTKGASTVLRWDTRNGVTLCQGCHFKAHKNSNYEWREIYDGKIRMIIEPVRDILEQKGQGIYKTTVDNLQSTYQELLAELDRIQNTEQMLFDDSIKKYDPSIPLDIVL